MENLIRESNITYQIREGEIFYCVPDCVACREYTAFSRCCECNISLCKTCEEVSLDIMKEAYEIHKKEFEEAGNNPISFFRFIDGDDWETQNLDDYDDDDGTLRAGSFYLYCSGKKVKFKCKRCAELEKIKKENAKLKVLLLSQNINKDILRSLMDYL